MIERHCTGQHTDDIRLSPECLSTPGVPSVLLALLVLQSGVAHAEEEEVQPEESAAKMSTTCSGPTWSSLRRLELGDASTCFTPIRSHCSMGFKSALSAWARANNSDPVADCG